MNENLNLVEILKNCPKDTKLYSILHGEITFLRIKKDDSYPIVCYQGECVRHFTAQGLSFYSTDGGECVLFPSKDQRDWSKFDLEPKFDVNTLQPFDKVLVRDCNSHKWDCNLFDRLNKTSQYLFVCICRCIFNQCIPYNDETKHLRGTTSMPPEKYITWKE